MSNILIHKVIHGPFYHEDEEAWGLIVSGQDEGHDRMYTDLVLTETEDDCWAIIRWLNKSILPWIMTMDGEGDVEEETSRLGAN